MFHLLKTLFIRIIYLFAENGHRKMEEQSTHINKTICTKSNFWEHLFKASYHTKCINLSATNGTFVTKGEIESYFLTTHWQAQIEPLGQHLIEPTSDSRGTRCCWAWGKYWCKP